MFLKLFGAVCVFAMLGGAGVACSDDDKPSSQEATATLCSDLDALGESLNGYADLTAASTIDDVEETQNEVKDAYDQVKDSAADVADARVDDLESAYDDLASAVDDVSGNDTVGDALTSIKAQQAKVELARANLASSVHCPA